MPPTHPPTPSLLLLVALSNHPIHPITTHSPPPPPPPSQLEEPHKQATSANANAETTTKPIMAAAAAATAARDRRFDRSAVDILLNGSFATADVRPTRQDPKVRTDPAQLPITMVREGTEEYHLFALTAKRRLHVAPTARQAPYRERVPRWVPARWKWPLENALSRFLGDGETEQRPWLLSVEVSWPHSHRWSYGAALLGLCPFLAWATGMGVATALAGAVAGFVHGIFLRARVEKRFDWETYGPALLTSSVVLWLALGVSGTPPSLRSWTIRELLWKPVSGCLGLVEWPLVAWLTLGLPFVRDPKALHHPSDSLVLAVLGVTLVYATNFMLPLGLWCGALVKVVPPLPAPAPTPPGGVGAVPQPPLVMREGLRQRGTNSIGPAAAMSPPGRAPPQLQPPESEESRLLAAAAPHRYRVDAASHPRRWVEPQASPYGDQYASPSPAGAYPRQRSSMSALPMGTGFAGNGGGGGGGGGVGRWEEEQQSRRGRQRDIHEPTDMELSSSPPAPLPMDAPLPARFEGLGRYETMNPHHRY